MFSNEKNDTGGELRLLVGARLHHLRQAVGELEANMDERWRVAPEVSRVVRHCVVCWCLFSSVEEGCCRQENVSSKRGVDGGSEEGEVQGEKRRAFIPSYASKVNVDGRTFNADG